MKVGDVSYPFYYYIIGEGTKNSIEFLAIILHNF